MGKSGHKVTVNRHSLTYAHLPLRLSSFNSHPSHCFQSLRVTLTNAATYITLSTDHTTKFQTFSPQTMEFDYTRFLYYWASLILSISGLYLPKFFFFFFKWVHAWVFIFFFFFSYFNYLICLFFGESHSQVFCLLQWWIQLGSTTDR